MKMRLCDDVYGIALEFIKCLEIMTSERHVAFE